MKKDALDSNEQRCKRINNKMARQKAFAKFRQREIIQIPLNGPVVSCNRSRLAMIKESYPQLRLLKWENTARLQ